MPPKPAPTTTMSNRLPPAWPTGGMSAGRLLCSVQCTVCIFVSWAFSRYATILSTGRQVSNWIFTPNCQFHICVFRSEAEVREMAPDIQPSFSVYFLIDGLPADRYLGFADTQT